MFDQIARRYDLLNRVISLGLDQSWRTKLINALPREGELLDVATGTADVALSIAQRAPKSTLVGLDPSVGMLNVGREKVERRGLQERVTLDVGDALAMPYADNRFEGCCVAFGIRNFPDRLQGLKEMARVTKPGGPVAILELSEPRGGVLAPFTRFHVHHVVPRLGALLSGNKEYRYLQRSVAAFPPPEQFKGLMEEAGLRDVEVSRMTFGVAHLYVGRAP
jgi:demethylmenaquinone methyltransferase/2-methoxy-6-polyprenyl-1,4-benzoquinol methylase